MATQEPITRTLNPATVVSARIGYEWSLFLYTNEGDFFMNSSCGTFGYAWRHFDGSFVEFLAVLTQDYFFGKLEHSLGATRKINEASRKIIWSLFQEFIKHVRLIAEASKGVE